MINTLDIILNNITLQMNNLKKITGIYSLKLTLIICIFMLILEINLDMAVKPYFIFPTNMLTKKMKIYLIYLY